MAEPNLIELDEAVSRIKQACESREKDSPSPFFFMVGAGISHPSVPLARDVIAHCKEMARTYHRTNDPGKTNTLDQYSHWFQTAYAEPDQRQRYLRRLIEGTPITHANFRLAHLLLDNTISNLVVTTNFDDFLSKALTLFGQPHIVCDHPSTVGRINHTRPMVQIVHLHGSYWFYDCCNLRGELEDRARQSRQTSSTMASLLDQILWERSPLVIGYSGWEGDVFMEALKRRTARPLGTNVYWFCHQRSKVDELSDELKGNPNVWLVVPPKPTTTTGSESTGTDEPASRQESLKEIEAKSSETRRSDEPTLPAQTVFDKLIQAFQLDAPELTRDPLGFFAKSLEESLPKDEASDSSSDLYTIKNIIERVRRAKQRDNQETAQRVLVPAESKLEEVRDALRRAEYREAIRKAEQIEFETLSTEKLEELAEGMVSAALGLLDNSEEELASYELILKIRDRQAAKADQSPLVRIQVAETLISKGLTLSALNRSDEAIACFDEVLGRYETASEPALKHQVAKALVNKSFELGRLKRYEEAIGFCDELVKKFGKAPEVSQKELVAKALFNKGVFLRALERNEEAIEAYREVRKRYTEAPEQPLQIQVAMALGNEGGALGAAHRYEEALALYDEVVRRYDTASEMAFRKRVAMALVNKGVRLSSLSRPEEEIAVYDEVVRRYGEAPELELQVQVAKALYYKGQTLATLERPEEERAVYEDIVRRYREATDSDLQSFVEKAQKRLRARKRRATVPKPPGQP